MGKRIALAVAAIIVVAAAVGGYFAYSADQRQPERVSLTAACELVFPGLGAQRDQGGPLRSTLDVMEKKQWDDADAQKAQRHARELEQIADRAPRSLERPLRTFVRETRNAVDDWNGGPVEVDMPEWAAAGHEITEQCW
jgi:pimeloyl-ACP methyl ester carboxylesterase